MSDRPPGGGPDRSPAEEALAVAALSDEVLPALIARLRASGLGELEVRSDGWRVRLRREITLVGGSAGASGSAMSGASRAAAAGLDEEAGVARSPAVGYFSPGRDVAVGRSVRAGDSLGSVDVLGIIQDVAAPIDGVISRVLAEPGQAVEYGQALAEIDALVADAITAAS